MRRFMAWVCLSFLVLSLVVSAAPACLNDREVERSERELKSRYQQPAPKIENPSPEQQDKTVPLAGIGIGSALLLTAIVICLPSKP